MEYQYLYKDFDEDFYTELNGCSQSEIYSQIKQMDSDWNVSKIKMSNAETASKEAFEKGEKNAYSKLFAVVQDVLTDARIEDQLMQRSDNSAGHNTDQFFSCIVPVHNALNKLGDQAREGTASKAYRDFTENGEEYRRIEGKSVFKLFLWPLLLAAFWFGMYRLITAPFMAEVLEKPFWESAAMAVSIILFFLFGFIFLTVGLGLLASAIASFIATAAYMLLALLAVGPLVEKLFPAVAAALENASEYIHILGLTVFVLTCIPAVSAVLKNAGAIGKKEKLKTLLEKMECSFSSSELQEERDFFGVMYEICCICISQAEELNKEYGDDTEYRIMGFSYRLSGSKVKEIIEQVRDHYQKLGDEFDTASALLH